MAKTTTTATMTREQRTQVAQLRARAQELGRAIGEWEHGQAVIADSSPRGWDDPKVAEYEAKIEQCRTKRHELLAQVAAIETPRRAA